MARLRDLQYLFPLPLPAYQFAFLLLGDTLSVIQTHRPLVTFALIHPSFHAGLTDRAGDAIRVPRFPHQLHTNNIVTHVC